MQSPEARLQRPSAVTLLMVVVLTIAGINLLRMVNAISQREFLSRLPGVHPGYLALTGLFWALASIFLLWGVWRRRSWARWGALLYFLLYALYYWLDRLLVARQSFAGSGFAWPFMLATSLVLLSLCFWILMRPKMRRYFGENNDRIH